MSKDDRIRLAHALFVESVIKPDSELRQQAHEQQCYHELMEWRDQVLEFLEEKRACLK
jgi:hypothetical protein